MTIMDVCNLQLRENGINYYHVMANHKHHNKEEKEGIDSFSFSSSSSIQTSAANVANQQQLLLHLLQNDKKLNCSNWELPWIVVKPTTPHRASTT